MLSVGSEITKWAASLTAFALLRSAAPAFPVALILGYSYFLVITSMSTVIGIR